MHEALWEFPEGGGVLEKIPSVGMDVYILQLHIAKNVNIVTCDVLFFNLLFPGSIHVILLAKCQQLGRCLADNTKKGQKAR